MKNKDRNGLEDRLKKRILVLIPSGTKLTPELYEQVKQELIEEVKLEFGAHDVPKAFADILVKLLMPKKPDANP